MDLMDGMSAEAMEEEVKGWIWIPPSKFDMHEGRDDGSQDWISIPTYYT